MRFIVSQLERLVRIFTYVVQLLGTFRLLNESYVKFGFLVNFSLVFVQGGGHLGRRSLFHFGLLGRVAVSFTGATLFRRPRLHLHLGVLATTHLTTVIKGKFLPNRFWNQRLRHRQLQGRQGLDHLKGLRCWQRQWRLFCLFCFFLLLVPAISSRRQLPLVLLLRLQLQLVVAAKR